MRYITRVTEDRSLTRVQPKEVAATLQQHLFFSCELRESISAALLHHLRLRNGRKVRDTACVVENACSEHTSYRCLVKIATQSGAGRLRGGAHCVDKTVNWCRTHVVACVDRVGEPPEVPHQTSLGSLSILLGLFRVIRRGGFCPVAIQSDSDHPVLSRLEVLAVGFNRTGVGDEDVVPSHVDLGGGRRCNSWRHLPVSIAKHCRTPFAVYQVISQKCRRDFAAVLLIGRVVDRYKRKQLSSGWKLRSVISLWLKDTIMPIRPQVEDSFLHFNFD